MLLTAALLFCLAVLMSAGCSDNNTPPPTSSGGTDTTGTTQQAVFSSDDFSPSAKCIDCHADQVAQWKKSMHAYSLRDPVWTALVKMGESAYTNAMDQGCAKCHGMIGSRAGETPWGGFIVDSLKPVVQEGITCDLCHTVSAIEDLRNGSIQLTPGDIKFGTISDPVENTFHKSEYKPLYAEAEYCGSCHDIITGSGLELETTFREWRDLGGFAVTGKTCNDCHMQPYSGQILGGPPRTLHDHGMPGVDVNLIAGPPDYGGQMDTVSSLLKNALTVTPVLPSSVNGNQAFSFKVRLLNDKTGHGVPSGAPFLRQMWLDVMITDSLGNKVDSSGQLDANGDLMNSFSELAPNVDSSLYNAQAKIFRADSVQTQLVWEAMFLENPAIMPGQEDTVSYTAMAPAASNGSLTIAIKLRYRTFPPYILRLVGLDNLMPLPIVDMFDTTISVAVQ